MYDWGKGKSFSHLSVVTGWGARFPAYSRDGQGDYMDQHTNDRYHAPWTTDTFIPTATPIVPTYGCGSSSRPTN
jgi:hypothetical protein